MDPQQYPQHEIDATQHQQYPQQLELDIDAVLSARMNEMRLKYEAQLDQFKSSLQDQFTTATQQSHVENGLLREELARLRGVQRVAIEPDIEMAEQNTVGSTAKRTRDPRPRPAPTQTPTKDPRTPPKSVRTQPTPTPEAPKTPRRSPPRRSPGAATSSAPEVPRSSPKPPRTPQTSSTSAPEVPRSSPKPPRTSSTLASEVKNKKSSQKRPGEYQMFAADIEKDAQTFKTAFHYHIRFMWGCLDSTRAPTSATPETVKVFGLRFQGLTMEELKRRGQIGRNLIDPAGIKFGFPVEETIRSKNNIMRAFFKLEESALLHVSSYLAKLGISAWAPDFSQSVYSLYNMAMRMCAIDTFRFLVAGTHYDFLRPNTMLVNNPSLLTRIYDHFIHHYMFNQWKLEIRKPGGTVNAAERNKGIQGRIRLHDSRITYLKDVAAPKGVQLMFSVKATSDDESTPTGSHVLAREERSQDADRLIRAVDKRIIQGLFDAGKNGPANNRLRRVAPPLVERNPSSFLEIPKGMPIQYYDVDWFNNRAPHDRAKLGAKLIVAFVPNSAGFLSGRGDDAMTVKDLTKKYGPEVFGSYDLDFRTRVTEESDDDGENSGAQANSDDSGESVGSRDSNEEESDGESAGSFIIDDEGAVGEDAQGSWSEDDYNPASFNATSYDMDLEAEIFGASGDESDESV